MERERVCVWPGEKAYTLKVIEETEAFYTALKSGKRENTEELSLK
jgi:hypothetical protein